MSTLRQAGTDNRVRCLSTLDLCWRCCRRSAEHTVRRWQVQQLQHVLDQNLVTFGILFLAREPELRHAGCRSILLPFDDPSECRKGQVYQLDVTFDRRIECAQAFPEPGVFRTSREADVSNERLSSRCIARTSQTAQGLTERSSKPRNAARHKEIGFDLLPRHVGKVKFFPQSA